MRYLNTSVDTKWEAGDISINGPLHSIVFRCGRWYLVYGPYAKMLLNVIFPQGIL